jgi:hypothetical protein
MMKFGDILVVGEWEDSENNLRVASGEKRVGWEKNSFDCND